MENTKVLIKTGETGERQCAVFTIHVANGVEETARNCLQQLEKSNLSGEEITSELHRSSRYTFTNNNSINKNFSWTSGEITLIPSDLHVDSN